MLSLPFSLAQKDISIVLLNIPELGCKGMGKIIKLASSILSVSWQVSSAHFSRRPQSTPDTLTSKSPFSLLRIGHLPRSGSPSTSSLGVSAYLVWVEGLENEEVKEALALFGVQLGLNASWSILFFGLRSPLYALLEVLLLSRRAASLLIPYILWVSLAAALNLSIFLMNG